LWLHFTRKSRLERDQICGIVPRLYSRFSEAHGRPRHPPRRGLHVMMSAAIGTGSSVPNRSTSRQHYLQWEEEMKRCSSRIALSCSALLFLFGSSSRPVQAQRNCEELEVGRWNVSSDFGKRFVNQDLKNCAGGRHLRVIASETQIDCQQYETSYAPIPKHVCGDIGRPTPHYYLCIAKGLACSPRQ
jgi:hypothetical protein